MAESASRRQASSSGGLGQLVYIVKTLAKWMGVAFLPPYSQGLYGRLLSTIVLADSSAATEPGDIGFGIKERQDDAEQSYSHQKCRGIAYIVVSQTPLPGRCQLTYVS